MVWDFETEPEFQTQLDWMREFIDGELLPLEPVLAEMPDDEWDLVRRHLQRQVKDRGLWGAFLDPKLGGPGFGQLKLALMSELIGRVMFSMTIFGTQAPDSGNCELLAHGGTEEQKQKWMFPNLNGDLRSAFCLTEPFFAGADPTRIGTTAELDGDEWVINGHKWFASNGSIADFLLVFAETNPEQRPHKHASVFVVEKDTPGMNIVRDVPTMAHPEPTFGRVGNHAEILFEDCRVPVGNLIGRPGDGFVLAQQRLGGGRIHHAMRWIGQAKRSLDIMCERAVSRESHGRLLGQHQMIQDYIARSHTEIEAARLLTFQTAWKMDKHGASATRADISMVKQHVSRVVLDVLDRTIQVCGALGYSSDLPVESWYRSTRFGPIGDGPDEVHRTVVARTLLKNYSPVEGWPTEHIPSRLPAGREKFAQLLTSARAGAVSTPSFDLTGKVAVVTGGSKGLGRAMVLGFAERGADIVVASRKLEPCEEVAAEVRDLGRRAVTVACHVGEWAQCAELVDAAVAEFGRIDVLVNNAGIAPVPPSLLGVTEDLFDKTVAVNLKGPLRLTALAAEHMAPGSTVINISSKASTHPSPFTVVYAAAKAGLNALTKAAAQEYAPRGIRVNAIVCGMFHTDSFHASVPTPEMQEGAASRVSLGRIGDADEIVGTALYLATDASSYLTGQCITLDGGGA